MNIRSLKDYVDKREKYITLFEILNDNDVPKDVRNEILSHVDNLEVPLYQDFNKGIKNILTYIKDQKKGVHKLTPDAYHLLNYIIVVFINDLIHKSEIIVAHHRKRRLSADDVEYVLGIYPRKNSKLIKYMINNAQYNVKHYIESKDIKERQSQAVRADTLIDPPKVEKYVKLIIKKDTIIGKYTYKNDIEQIEPKAIIYITGVLDTLIENIILSSTKTDLNADDILKAIDGNIEIKSLLLELFI